MAYSAAVLLDSVSPDGCRLTTMEVTLPRMVLAELNTHRSISKNSSSNRARPAKKTIEIVRADPFIPTFWGKNQPGMQAFEQLSPAEQRIADMTWRKSLGEALATAEELDAIGVHKQLVNRVLEPYMWHTVLLTATDWQNFYALRTAPDTQPELRYAALLMLQAYNASVPQRLEYGQWHMPLIQADEWHKARRSPLRWRMVSVGRCARVSYLTHHNIRDPEADIGLHAQLLGGGHMSPFEHVARPMTAAELAEGEYSGNFRGFHQYRKEIPGEGDYSQLHREIQEFLRDQDAIAAEIAKFEALAV